MGHHVTLSVSRVLLFTGVLCRGFERLQLWTAMAGGTVARLHWRSQRSQVLPWRTEVCPGMPGMQ